jgi:hypothetical protein
VMVVQEGAVQATGFRSDQNTIHRKMVFTKIRFIVNWFQ